MTPVERSYPFIHTNRSLVTPRQGYQAKINRPEQSHINEKGTRKHKQRDEKVHIMNGQVKQRTKNSSNNFNEN